MTESWLATLMLCHSPASSARHAHVLWRRLVKEPADTCAVIAADMGISRSRVQQMDWEALIRLMRQTHREEVLAKIPRGSSLSCAMFGKHDERRRDTDAEYLAE